MKQLPAVEQEFLSEKLFELEDSPHSRSRVSAPPYEPVGYRVYETSMQHSQRVILFLAYFVFKPQGDAIIVDQIVRRSRDKAG